MRDTERERGKIIGRGRSRLLTGSPSPMWEFRDHTLSQRQMLNHRATQASLKFSVQVEESLNYMYVLVSMYCW